MNNYQTALKKIDWDFPDSNKSDGIHSIHPYPAKFISEIPRSLIETIGLPKGTWVLDPFCGSGATLVEAQRKGIPSIGIDLNPIACLMCEVKTQPLSDNFMRLAEQAVSEAKNFRNNVSIPSIPNLDHWFRTDVQKEIARLLLGIESVEDVASKAALKLALSSILVRVSNQDSDTRYAAVEKNLNPGDVFQGFIEACEKIWNIKRDYHPETWQAEVLQKNILDVTKDDIPMPIGLVITSPPYPNAYEYWLYHKYRMFWLGYDPLKVKAAEIGARAHYFKKNHPTIDDFRNQVRYLMTLLHGVIVTGGHAGIVIGRSKIHGEIIDNAAIITEISEQVGFELIEKIQRTIASTRKSFNLSHANIKVEHILIFRR